jgi:micrococcal nuclease
VSPHHFGAVAQSVRAPPCHGGGCEFEPRRLRINIYMQQYVYKAFVVSIFDGDTITVNIDLGFDVWLKEQKIRLQGINAPEVRGEQRTQGIKSRNRLIELILNKEVIIETVKDKKEKFGRWLGKVYFNSELINEKLVQEGLAQKYLE